MATRLHYFGDVGIASTHRAHAELLLESLRRSLPDTYPTSLKHTYDDGTYVSVQRVSPGMETIDITADVTTKKKDKMVWTLLYAPCPAPDPQDWIGWIEANKDTLLSTNFLSEFMLIGWGAPIWAPVHAVLVSDTGSIPTTEIEHGGYCNTSFMNFTRFGVNKDLLCGQIVAFRYTSLKRTRTYSISIAGLFVGTYTVNDYSNGTLWSTGDYFVRTDIHGTNPWESYGDTASLQYPPTLVEATGEWDGGAWQQLLGTARGWVADNYFSGSVEESYISWQDPDGPLGFYKIEWTSYNPSTYLNNDNYLLFYEYRLINDIDYTSPISHPELLHTNGSWYLNPASGWSWWWEDYGPTDWEDDNLIVPHYKDEEIVSGFKYKYTNPLNNLLSEGAMSSYTCTYKTYMYGKYEGAGISELIGTAVKNNNDAWSGENIFPWMSRCYDKALLLSGEEGQEAPAEHHLLLASYLIATAGGYDPWTPGTSSEGINKVAYRRWFSGQVTLDYSASHPGWHDVYTSDPDSSVVRTWRAYGDLFAALKVIKRA